MFSTTQTCYQTPVKKVWQVSLRWLSKQSLILPVYSWQDLKLASILHAGIATCTYRYSPQQCSCPVVTPSEENTLHIIPSPTPLWISLELIYTGWNFYVYCVTAYQVASSCASVQSSARCDRPQQTWPSVAFCIPLLLPFLPEAAVPSSLCSLDALVADLVAAGSEPLRQPIQLEKQLWYSFWFTTIVVTNEGCPTILVTNEGGPEAT